MHPVILGALGLAPLYQPLAIGADPAALSAEGCGGCHAAQYTEWSGSRHHVAHTNPLYQAGLSAEPEPFCVRCHAPLAEQTAEVLPNLSWYREQGPHARGLPVGERAPEPLAAEGVTCVVCHLREGTVLTPEATSAIHPTRAAPELRSGAVCRDCHEFPVPRTRGGKLVLTDVPMQSTWSEWEAWGGAQTCVDCHLPDGRHLFRGAHDTDWLRESVSVRRDGDALVVESVGVGHALPSGDLFRHLTLEVRRGDAWTPIAWIGRRYALVSGPDGEGRKELVADTSLVPGAPQRHPAPRGPWRLVYHYGSAVDEARGYLSATDLTVSLAEGTN